MQKITLLLCLLTFNAVLIIIERLSPTTKILLQPYSFLRVHEAVQVLFLTTLSIIISFYIFKELTNNFSSLKTKHGVFLGLGYLIGTYFYATGNGWHEISSFLFNTFCNTKHIPTTVCESMFMNDYYIGNILYFSGLLVSNVVFILFERGRHYSPFNNKTISLIIANGLVYALAFVSYAAFDPVLVGLYFTVIAACVINLLFFTAKKPWKILPFTLYCSVGYTVGAILSIIIRFH